MSHQIIEQPDGKYMVYNSVTESVEVTGLTEEELVQNYLKIEEDKIRAGVRKIIGKLEEGEKPYYQFTLTYEEALERELQTRALKKN
jgi:hypothetical protein